MPSIPISQGVRVREQALQGGYQNNIDVSSGTRAVAQGLDALGEGVDRYQRQQAETQAWQAQDAIYRQYRDWLTNEQKASQGEKAAGFTERVDAWWEEAKKQHTEALSPLAQQIVGRSLGAIRRSAYDNATAYQTQQLDIANSAAFNAGISSLGQAAISATPDMRAAMVEQGLKTIRARAAEKGVDASPDELKFTTGVHTNVLSAMVQVDPAKAREYYNANRDQIDATRHDEINRTIERAGAANDGERAAAEVWSTGGPKSYAEPVSSDVLQAQIDKRFANDPERRKAATAALKERIAAFNQAQGEHTTAATNTVYQLMQQGVPLSKLKAMPEWGTLVALNAKAADGIEYMIEQRALHRAQTADALEGAELKRLQRQQHLLSIKNWDEYAKAQDPAVLAGMPRAAIQALAPVIGQDNTEKLLAKKDKLDNPATVAEAKIDDDQFKAFVERVLPGVVSKKKPTAEEKLLLIQMRNQVESTLDAEQRGAKRPLTREEKDAIIQREVNRTVTVPGGWFSSDQQRPVIALTPAQQKKAVIPEDVRRRAVTLMNVRLSEATTDAERQRYAPTPENLRDFVFRNPELFPTNGR